MKLELCECFQTHHQEAQQASSPSGPCWAPLQTAGSMGHWTGHPSGPLRGGAGGGEDFFKSKKKEEKKKGVFVNKENLHSL